MKIHSGWLAAGLLLFAVLACNVSKNTNNSNNTNKNSNSSTSTRPANADVYIDQINMAKDENGEPGESTTSFAPDEHTVHCVINLNKAKAGTKVKFTWIGVDVENNKVHAHLTRPKDWPKGTYKVEVYINGALDKTITYTVE